VVLGSAHRPCREKSANQSTARSLLKPQHKNVRFCNTATVKTPKHKSGLPGGLRHQT
jgi:hypothetical protein